jgi:hypothetical protein
MTAMRAALRQQARTRKLICVSGACECCVVWRDPETGLRCKARIDKLLPAPHNLILDLKSASSAEPMAFARDAARFGYDIQAAHYVAGVKAATGRECHYLLIPQEKEPPYLSSLIDATDERCQPTAAECGEQKRRAALDTLATCLRDNHWPGYGDEVYPLQLPAWAVPHSVA